MVFVFGLDGKEPGNTPIVLVKQPAATQTPVQRLDAVCTQFFNVMSQQGTGARDLQKVLDENVKNKAITPQDALNILDSYNDAYFKIKENSSLLDKKPAIDLLRTYFEKKVEKTSKSEELPLTPAQRIEVAALNVLDVYSEKAEPANFQLKIVNKYKEDEFNAELDRLCKESGVTKKDVTEFLAKHIEDLKHETQGAQGCLEHMQKIAEKENPAPQPIYVSYAPTTAQPTQAAGPTIKEETITVMMSGSIMYANATWQGEVSGSAEGKSYNIKIAIRPKDSDPMTIRLAIKDEISKQGYNVPLVNYDPDTGAVSAKMIVPKQGS